MSWTDTERFYRTMRVVEQELDVEADGTIPWRASYADVFGTPERLRFALLTRWRTVVEAQGEHRSVAELAAEHPGLARVAGVRVLAGAGR